MLNGAAAPPSQLGGPADRMERFLSGSDTLPGGEEEQTAKVAGDGDDCVGSDWKETPEQEDSDEDEYEKVNTATRTRLSGGDTGGDTGGDVAFMCEGRKRDVGPVSSRQAASKTPKVTNFTSAVRTSANVCRNSQMHHVVLLHFINDKDNLMIATQYNYYYCQSRPCCRN